MVNSIAADIYESLKQNGDIKQVLSSVFNREKRQSVLQNLADSLMLKQSIGSVKTSEREDSGLYSGAEETNDYYSSSCQVENKHVQLQQEDSTVESYEDFVANLPLPVAEFSKETVREGFQMFYQCFFYEHFSFWSDCRSSLL